MDFQTGLVYVGVVVISAAVILFVSMFGIMEKSYEEAIAEQRKLPDELLLNKKEKNKEKKHKNKAAKKAKEKKEEREEKEEKPEHVQFEETPQILTPETPIQESNKGNKKKNKVDKVKPILLNKDEPSVVVNEPSASQVLTEDANHFEIIHPKDDLELIRTHSRENLHQVQPESTVNKSPKESPTKFKKNAKDAKKREENNKTDKKETMTANATPQPIKETTKEVKEQLKDNVVKESKEVKEVVKEIKEVKESTKDVSNKETKKQKKKNDILSQIGGDKDGVDVSLLVLLIQKTELSRSEIQVLINQLLNKQLDNPLEHSEWSEGRADPVIKLKKQLAEKEKALVDEREASVAFQSKLKELRTELNNERSRLTGNLRQLEEALNAKITEAQTLHTRMQHILESHAAEKQGFARQIEQLQTKVSEDAAIIHKMQEDQGQTQGHLQQELITQRKQMEIQFNQMRENENALKTQLGQKHVEIQDLQNEFQATCESSTAEIEMLRQQLGIMQGQLMHTERQLQLFKEAGDRQIEDSHRAHADLEHRLKSAQRHEQELQKQLNALQLELNVAKTEANDASVLKIELNKVESELNKLKSELSASKNEAQTEAVEITTLKVSLANTEEELAKLKDQFHSTQDELQKSLKEITHLKMLLNNEKQETEIVRVEFHKTKNGLKQALDDVNKYKVESQRLQEELAQVRAELAKLQKSEIDESLQLQIAKLREENDNLKTQLTITEHSENKQENGLDEKVKKSEVQLVEHANILAQKESQLDSLKTELSRKEEECNQLTAQIEALRSDANKHHNQAKRLQDDLDAQRLKNDELRIKNWKVMEALSAAESKYSSAKSNDDLTLQMQQQQQEATKAFLQRVFPEIKVSEKSYDKWISAFENRVYTVLSELRNKSISDADVEKQNKNLQGMVSHYKQIIDDTEGMLNKLQIHIESEETRWQSQLRQKENEVANLRLELNELRKKSVKKNETGGVINGPPSSDSFTSEGDSGEQ